MGWWTDLKGLGNVVKEQANTAIPRDFGEFIASVVGGPIGITEYKKSKAVGAKADEVEAYEKREKRRAAIERAMGGNPLGRTIDAPKPLDMTPWASHEVAKSVMGQFMGGSGGGGQAPKAASKPKSAYSERGDFNLNNGSYYG